MRIKCQPCDLTSLLLLTPPETGRQLGYYISNSICVNFNAFIQKEAKGERCTSFPHVFCASLNEQCGPSGPFWRCEIVLQGISSTFQVFGHFSYKAVSLSLSPSRDLHFRNQLWLTKIQKLSPISQGL